jgi:hypothetical protein
VPSVSSIFAPVAAVLAAVPHVLAGVAAILTAVESIFDAIAEAAVVPRIAPILGPVAVVFAVITTILPAVAYVLAPVRPRAVPIGACLREERRGRHQRQYQSLHNHSSSHRLHSCRSGRRYELGRRARAWRCFAILHSSRGRL